MTRKERRDMKIVRLEAQNIKRLKAIEITPDGNLVVIGGKNGQGKSSALDSISYAIEGKGAVCQEPVRKGEKKAKVVCDLGELIVTRTFTAEGGGSLSVTNKNGDKKASPQAILDKLMGKLGFDPLAFSRLDDKKQLDTLKTLVGLDFTAQNQRRQLLYDERTQVNREAKQKEALLAQVPLSPDVPAEEVKVSDLLQELEKINTHNNSITSKQEEKTAVKTRMDEIDVEVEKLLTEYETLKAKIGTIDTFLSDNAVKDKLEIQTKINTNEETNKKVRDNKRHNELKTELDAKAKESETLSGKIEAIDKEKSESLSKAKFPVEGLSFDDSGLLYNSIPFSQCSSSEQLRVSVAMGIALNPELKVLIIRDGSLLDDDSLQMVAEMAQTADAQVWMERVSDGKEVSVVIEDGEVKK